MAMVFKRAVTIPTDSKTRGGKPPPPLKGPLLIILFKKRVRSSDIAEFEKKDSLASAGRDS